MITNEDGQCADTAETPKCVAQLLTTLDLMSSALADDRPVGPYALDAVLDDILLCPAMEAKPGLAGDAHAALVDAVKQARNAASVMRTCPGSDRQWAVERLRESVAQARHQLAARVDDAAASGHRESLFGGRCATCVFAGK